MNCKGNYKNYYDYVKTRVLFDNSHIKIKKNFLNLGFWLVKTTQNKHVLNLFKIRIQF